MIVVDANVTAYLLIVGDKTSQAQRVFSFDPDWWVPPIWEHEFVNILATYAKREQKELERYQLILKQAVTMVQGYTEAIDMSLLLEIAVRHQLSAYDAQYVYLAKMRTVPLITEDARILKAVPEIAKSMADYIKTF